MSNWIESDLGYIPLKKFRSLDLDYIRVFPNHNVLMGKTRRKNKIVEKVKVSIEKTYWCEIPISIYERHKDIAVFHLHSSNCETFLTLLNLLPDKLFISYYPENQSINMKNWQITQECLTFTSVKENKNGKVIKSNCVTINGYIHKDNKKDLAGYGKAYIEQIPIKE